jgi:hypothetical protein
MTNNALDKVKKIFEDDGWYSTMDLCKKYCEKNDKNITLRRMSQLLFKLLAKNLVQTQIKNTGNKGRFRQWKKID